MAHSAEYIPLSQHPRQGDNIDDEALLDEEPRTTSYTAKRRDSFPSLNPTLIISTFLVSFLGFGLTLYSIHFRSTSAIADRSYDVDVSQLRRPSLYLGLERVPEIQNSLAAAALKENSSAQFESGVEELATLPVGPGRANALARVSSRYPDRHFLQDGWVLLTQEDTALMRFSTPNTSTCKFHLSFPTRYVLTTTHRLLTLENPGSISTSSSPRIQIYTLKSPASASFDIEKATWSTRPGRASLLPAVAVTFGTEFMSPAFACVDEHIVIEVACIGTGEDAEGGCRVEWKEEAGEPLIGMELLAG